MEKKLAHLEMIQGIVNRLASNSFLLKGWTVVLVSALFALTASEGRVYFVYLAFLPAIAFWVLDGYFLWQERLFRALYDYVRKLKEEDVDFSMDTSIIKDKVKPWFAVMFSITLLIFHGIIVCAIVIVMLFPRFND